MKQELIELLAAIGAAVLVAVGGHLGIKHLERVSYDAGAATERAKWTAQIEKSANEALQHSRDTERAANERIAKINQQHEQELKNAQSTHDRFVADLYAGRIRLRDSHAAACPAAGDATSAAAPGSDGAVRGELSPEAARFLWGEAERADRLADSLRAAQETILTYRGMRR